MSKFKHLGVRLGSYLPDNERKDLADQCAFAIDAEQVLMVDTYTRYPYHCRGNDKRDQEQSYQ